MNDFARKIFNKEILFLLLAGLILFGMIKYIDYHLFLAEKGFDFKIAQNTADIASLRKDYESKIQYFNDAISGTQDNLTNVLQKEQEKNSNLVSQVDEISNTVGALSKLSKTDPELLKKYSKIYFLNEHYVPISLSDIGVDFRSTKSTNYQILTDVLPHIEDMINDSNADGLGLRTLSAYRSFVAQANLKSNYVVSYGAGTANRFSADQGYSEHQLGTAIDFTTVKLNGVLTGFDKTPEYKWMGENAYKYGFVISYPAGNAYYKFEPWHWRFVGVELATKLHDDNKYFYDEDQRVIDNYLVNLFD